MSETLSEHQCVICRMHVDDDEDVATVGRGLNTLIEFSIQYKDLQLHNYLLSRPSVVKVHNQCRKNYTSKYNLEQCLKRKVVDEESEAGKPKSMRSNTPAFDYKIHCFICAELCVPDARHPDRVDQRCVWTKEVNDSVLDMCIKRGDEFAVAVKGRINMCNDLRCEDSVYHRKCHTDFFSISVYEKPGRPVDVGMSDSFEKLCEWLEISDCELLTLEELTEKARIITGRDEVYSEKWLKIKLQDRYKDHIVFAEVQGRKNVICWKKMATYIVNNKWYESRKNNIEDDSERIVVTAAKLLKEAIRETEYQTDVYPKCEQFKNVENARNWMPKLLNVFLDNLVCHKVKKVAVGHSIIQSVRPRTTIAPVLFGVGVSVDKICGSKAMINTLYQLGFSISYDEILRFKQSLVQSDDDVSLSAYPDCFTQFAADNVDHNICTLDGMNTFHGMGIIAMSIPCCGQSISYEGSVEASIPRLARRKVGDIVKNKGVPMLHYEIPDTSALSGMVFKPFSDLHQLLSQPISTDEDLLWHTGWFFGSEAKPRPAWAGFMHDIHAQRDNNVAVSADVQMFPIIDKNPNDLSCIFSTLVYISKHSERLNIPTPCITFDHPLWLKAVDIIHSEKLNIVCRLGPFHTLMSFLGSIGNVMSGCGLTDALECCYGANSIIHMMAGKAVKRALRGHFLMDSALNILLLRKFLGVQSNVDEHDVVANSICSFTAEDIEDINVLYEDIVNRKSTVADLSVSGSISKLKALIEDRKVSLAEKSRTAKLWLQYSRYVDIVKSFIRAERTSNWSLHLVCVAQMLNLFASTGHINYAKSARLYLQLMIQMEVDNQWLHDKFMDDGFHSVRRGSRFWAGLSTDLMIEQVMMKAIKGKSGLTHGRGMSDSVRLTWVKSLHKCAAIQSALSSLTDKEESHEDVQHADASKSQARRDFSDICKLVEWLEINDPFDDTDRRLRSLCSGISAGDCDSINCDCAEDVGATIMLQMDGMAYTDVVIRKADRVKTLSQINTVAVPVGKKINIDAGALFSRLVIIMSRCSDLSPYFAYELNSMPAALFKDNFMRKPDKAQLKKELIKSLDVSYAAQAATAFVIDGGCLLHKVKWQRDRDVTYTDIAQQYVAYLQKHYSTNAAIVFDGYCNGPSIKDHEHQRRSSKCAPDVVFSSCRTAYHDQSAFLANDNNKKKFVDFLIICLENAGFAVHQAKDDADTLIVKTALVLARDNSTITVVANDTDVLVLLIYHCHDKINNIGQIYILSESSQRKTQRKELISVNEVCTKIGDSNAKILLSIHAMSGCDSTSSLFGHGKKSIFKIITQSPSLMQFADVIGSFSGTREAVTRAGLQILACIYGGKPNDSLNQLRYSIYCHLTSTCTHAVMPERLPPTVNAAKFHILRSHLQVLQWKTFMTSTALPEEWGWTISDGRCVPIATDIEVAPADILNVVRCKCHSDSRRPCGTSLCSCRKHGLECVAACKHCNGTSCENSAVVDVLLLTESEDDIVVVSSEQLPEEDNDDNLDYFIPWVVEEVV